MFPPNSNVGLTSKPIYPYPHIHTGVQLQNATWGALVFGNTPRLLQPRSGGILGLQPGSCHPTGLSCAPSFLDTMAAETGLPKIVTFCGSEVGGCLMGALQHSKITTDHIHIHTG